MGRKKKHSRVNSSQGSMVKKWAEMNINNGSRTLMQQSTQLVQRDRLNIFFLVAPTHLHENE